MTTDWVKISCPKPGELLDGYVHYIKLKNWFDEQGYKYAVDYKFEWKDTGQYVPDYIYCNSDVALLFKLKYGTKFG